MILNADQRRFWYANGFIVLPGFFEHDQIDQQAALHDRVWDELPTDIVVDDLDTQDRQYVHNVDPSKRRGRFKLNDLYLKYPETRSLSLDPRLVSVLEQLVIDKPVLCNTLDLDYGSAQSMHVDSLYMTPASPQNLIACWIALEDVHPDAGPLEYYPGSHMIPQYKFSTGSCHAVPSEMKQWSHHMESWVEKLGLKPQNFLPKKGDMLIWHAYLYHGGSAIRSDHKTRKTLVNHYYVESDARHLGLDLVPEGGGFWQRRPHQVVPTVDRHSDPAGYANAIMNNAASEAPSLEDPPIASATSPSMPASPSNTQQPQAPKVESLLRTTLHYYRQWRRDVGSIIKT